MASEIEPFNDAQHGNTTTTNIETLAFRGSLYFRGATTGGRERTPGTRVEMMLEARIGLPFVPSGLGGRTRGSDITFFLFYFFRFEE